MSAETVHNHFRRQGAEKRQEEIITRLQDEWENPNGNDSWAHCLCISHYHQIIALIKGETE